MAENTKIQWCHHSWNPWCGCTKVSEGCRNCYAEKLSGRNPSVLGVWGPQGTRVVASDAQWKEPLKWNRLAAEAMRRWTESHRGKMACDEPPPERPRVFCASLADVFEDWGGQVKNSKGELGWVFPDGNWYWDHTRPIIGGMANAALPMRLSDVRRRLFKLPHATPHLDWLLPTKRPENVMRMIRDAIDPFYESHGNEMGEPNGLDAGSLRDLFSNLWLGTSIENADYISRIDHLRQIPAAVKFLSIEPLLGPMPNLDLTGIDWVIIGGESGPGARECRVEHVRSIARQCREAGVLLFVKQMGAYPTESADNGPAVRAWGNAPIRVEGDRVRVILRDSKGGDPEEWPESLRVREVPEGV